MISWKRDIVEEVQNYMNTSSSLENKGMISSMLNEIVALRTEVERLETKLANSTPPTLIKSLHVTFDREGQVDSVESKKYG